MKYVGFENRALSWALPSHLLMSLSPIADAKGSTAFTKVGYLGLCSENQVVIADSHVKWEQVANLIKQYRGCVIATVKCYQSWDILFYFFGILVYSLCLNTVR